MQVFSNKTYFLNSKEAPIYGSYGFEGGFDISSHAIFFSRKFQIDGTHVVTNFVFNYRYILPRENVGLSFENVMRITK